MHKLFFITLFLLTCVNTFSQKKHRFSMVVSYGPQVNLSFPKFDETGGPFATRFYKKKTLGTYGGMDIQYNMKKSTYLSFGYSKTQNVREVDFLDTLNNVEFSIKNFTIRHITNNYKLVFGGKIPELFNGFGYEIGLLYTRFKQQNIEIYPGAGGVYFNEGNYKDSNLEEAGLIMGINYTKKIMDKLEVGIRARVYYLASITTLETISVTPTVIYHF